LFRVAASAAITALVVVPAMVASPASAHALTGGITLAIDSISPQYATATSTVVVSGTVTNGTGSALAGLSVELNTSQSVFPYRELMEEFSDGSNTPDLVQDGNPFLFAVTVRPGGTASWRAEFTAADAGMAQFGVYGLEAELTDPVGTILATDRSLLPFWAPSDVGDKLKVAWIWPLIDQPYTQACGWLTSDALEPSLAAGGRLDNLLTAGTSDPQAQLTWAVDPALLGDVETLGSPHQVGAADCTDQTAKPASPAASAWLSTLKAATAAQPVIVTPYANVDVAALVHHGLTSDLASAYRLGQEVADPVLDRAFLISIAFPAGGLADQSVLTALAATEHVPSVVLSSNEMPQTSGFDDAVSSWASGAGTTMSVLLADSTLTNVLKGAGANSAAGRFAIEQRFLAETAMITSEAPYDARSLVVSPPETWNPSRALAADLLRETTTAPWLQSVQLESLTGTHGAQGQSTRKPLPALRVSTHELGPAYLANVSALDTQLAVYSSMLYPPQPGYTTQLSEALAATESSAWRDGAASQAQGRALVTGLTQYLNVAEGRVKIIPTGEISMAGASGALPVTIENTLKRQSVQVRLVVKVAAARGLPSTLTVRQTKLVTIPPGQLKLVTLSVHSAPQGSTTIYLSLSSANGTVLPWTTGANSTKLTVNSTRYGQAILILIAGAIGLLLLSSAFRSSRRRAAAAAADDHPSDDADPHGGGGEHGSPGNVMTSAQDPTEAPDDLADARRWADDA
jgi:Family of unknown function (DUF6049)